MTALKLTAESITILNRLGHDPNFAWTKVAAGFAPADKIECLPSSYPSPEGLGDYLDSLSGASMLQGFSGFVTPASPEAAADPVSDEFDAGSLDPSWTRLHVLDPNPVQRGANPAVSGGARESFTARPGWLLLQPTAANASCGFTKSLGSGTDLTDAATIYCRFSMDSNAASDGDSFAMNLSQTISNTIDPDNCILVELARASTNNTWALIAIKRIATAATTLYSASLTSFAQPIQGLAVGYFLFEGAMTYTIYALADQGCWKELGGFTLATTSLLPDRLSFVVNSQSSQAPVYGIDYVRREPGLYLTK